MKVNKDVLRLINKISTLLRENPIYTPYRNKSAKNAIKTLLNKEKLKDKDFSEAGLLIYLQTLRHRLSWEIFLVEAKTRGLGPKSRADQKEINQLLETIDYMIQKLIEKGFEHDNHIDEKEQENFPEPQFNNNPELFGIITGFFSDTSTKTVMIEVPYEIFTETEPIDMDLVENQILSLTQKKSLTVKQIASSNDYCDNYRVSVAVTFIGSLFLETQQKVELKQEKGDVRIIVAKI